MRVHFEAELIGACERFKRHIFGGSFKFKSLRTTNYGELCMGFQYSQLDEHIQSL